MLCCVVLSQVCHRGHTLTEHFSLGFYCDCGSGQQRLHSALLLQILVLISFVLTLMFWAGDLITSSGLRFHCSFATVRFIGTPEHVTKAYTLVEEHLESLCGSSAAKIRSPYSAATSASAPAASSSLEVSSAPLPCDLASLLTDYECCICIQVMEQPVTLPCGHSACQVICLISVGCLIFSVFLISLLCCPPSQGLLRAVVFSFGMGARTAVRGCLCHCLKFLYFFAIPSKNSRMLPSQSLLLRRRLPPPPHRLRRREFLKLSPLTLLRRRPLLPLGMQPLLIGTAHVAAF